MTFRRALLLHTSLQACRLVGWCYKRGGLVHPFTFVMAPSDTTVEEDAKTVIWLHDTLNARPELVRGGDGGSIG